MHLIRWICVIPFAILGWYLCLFAGLFAMGVLDWLCPRELIVSGYCTAEWYSFGQEAFIVAFSSLSAAVVILFASFMSPANKKKVAITTFIIGVLVSIFLIFQTSSWHLLLGPIIVGLITLKFLLPTLELRNAS